MKDQQATLLEYYARECAEYGTHVRLLNAAQDVRLTTSFLITKAVEEVRAERAGKEVRLIALLVLQQRATSEVLEAAFFLLESADPAERQLSAKVLREFPSLDEAPYPHSAEAVQRLKEVAMSETNDEVLGWFLYAIGWQRLPAAAEFLLGFINDKRPSIRRIIGNNLFHLFPENQPMPVAVADAFLQLAKDTDCDIRWGVYYDIASYPDLFTVRLPSLKQQIRFAKNDPDERVQEQARKADNALSGIQKPTAGTDL